MSDDLEAPHTEVLAPASKDLRTKTVEAARDKLSRYVNRAVEILTELAESSENDRVRLAAVDSILDRSGVVKATTQEVHVSSAEHEAATRAAEELVKGIARNKEQAHVSGISLDALIVHESEGAS